jgi:hypothetical protein
MALSSPLTSSWYMVVVVVGDGYGDDLGGDDVVSTHT